MQPAPNRDRGFTHPGPCSRRNIQGSYMLDLLVAVLGTGGILLMAAYAALCDRI